MPELPEVEKARRELQHRCVPGRIVSAEMTEDTIVFPQPIRGESLLAGRRLKSIDRRGKWLIINLESDKTELSSLLVHFGMTGRLEYLPALQPISNYKSHKRSASADGEADTWPPRWCKFILKIKTESSSESVVQVAFTDPRRLGRVHFIPNPKVLLTTESPLGSLAPDAFLNLPSIDEFMAVLEKSARPIKALLLDQTASGGVVSGIGNWLADEVLYQSRIHPESKCYALSSKDVFELRRCIQYVLETACQLDSDLDQMPDDWLVHYRWSKRLREPQKMPDGNVIRFLTVGGRTSAVVPSRQRLVRVQTAAAGSKSATEPETGIEQAVRPTSPTIKRIKKRAAALKATDVLPAKRLLRSRHEIL